MNPKAEFEEVSSSDDLKLIIARSQSGGKLDPGEAGMLSGVFHLHEQEARQVMTPIPAVVTVDVSETAEEALRRCVDSGHTRLVVTEDGNTDRIRGIVHNNSLARRLMSEGPDASIEPSVKDALIVPETKPLDDLLADLQRERASMAVVIDEYGRTAGIVSVEDIVEEVVGEIADETDPAVAGVRRLANGDWWVRGHVPITDLADYGLELPVDSDAYNSVGGFVFGELGRLPKRGDMVRSNGYSLRVESVRENRIEAVRIRDHGTDETAAGRPSRARPPRAPERNRGRAFRPAAACYASAAGGCMWCVKLSDSQRDAVRALIRAQGELGPSLTAALEALDYARWDDLPDAELPWDRVTQLARGQGIGEADVGRGTWPRACPPACRALRSSRPRCTPLAPVHIRRYDGRVTRAGRTRVVLAVVAALLVCASSAPRPFRTPSIHAHRGGPYAERRADVPENTLPAFSAAADAGYVLEFDVKQTPSQAKKKKKKKKKNICSAVQ